MSKRIYSLAGKWVWLISLFHLFTLSPLTAVAQEFDPTPPGNPGANYWYSDKGELVVDDFKTGHLEGALSAALGNGDPSDVATIIVAGIIDAGDVRAIRKYANCGLLDLSRCTGVTELPTYAFEETKLESVYLPSTIEKIGRYAFSKCYNLKTMTVHALTPPEIGDYAFYKTSQSLIVYVPATAVQLYMEAEGWKDFVILPIQDGIRSLTVALPEGTNVKDYEGMWLEIVNPNNGMSMHFVMTDRQQYSFHNIVSDTKWNVTLRNERGDAFGHIDNVEVGDKNVTATFAALSKPLNTTLKVTIPDGSDVTKDVQISWTDAAGNYLSQTSGVNGLPEGTQLVWRIVLPKDLAMTYLTPAATPVTVSPQLSTVNCQLSTIPSVTLSGNITDATTGLPLAGATITATQTFGTYTKTLTATSGADGNYSLALSDMPTSVTFAADGYLSYTKDNCQLSTVNCQLLPLTGAALSLGFTFTPCVEEGERGAESEDWYADFQNVDYTIYNETQGRPITLFSVHYPQLVLMEDVSDGDVLRLTATSRNDRFMPVEATTTIAEQQGQVTFAITELGKIAASFARTTNSAVSGTLYNSGGQLVASRMYADAKLTFDRLPDGDYTLVTMGTSELFNTIGTLDGLADTKLTEGIDYMLNRVSVVSGIIRNVLIDEVPKFDESKLYYTGEGTSFSVNKSEVVAGNYVTLTARLDFKPEYAEGVSQIQLMADIPDGCQFVEYSVMLGNNLAPYTLNGRRVTVPVENYTERMRFCVIPTKKGNYSPNAFAQFDLNGGTITQPIGAATFSAKDISLIVPSVTSLTYIPTRGVATSASKVDIYDGETLIGEAIAKGNGTWFASCQLNNPVNLSTHYIKAVVTTRDGVEITSEAQECAYNKNSITVKKVLMYHNNKVIPFDFHNPSDKQESYSWAPKGAFTFTIDLTNNDPAVVTDVVLYVKLRNGMWDAMDATYDAEKGLWVAAGEFGKSPVVNVKVDFIANQEIRVNDQQLKSIFTDTNVYDELKDYCQRVDAFFSNYTGSDEDGAAFIKLCEEVMLPEDVQELRTFEEKLKTLPDDEINAMMKEVLEKEPTDEFEAYGEDTNYDKYYNITAGDYQHIYRSCEGLTVADVPEGSQVILTEDGNTIYIYTSKTRICYVDFTNDIWYEVYKISPAETRNDVIDFEYNWQSIIWDSENLMRVAEEFGQKAANATKEAAMNQAIADRCTNAALKAYYAEQAAKFSQRAAGLMKVAGRFKHMSSVFKGAPLLDMAINSYKYYQKAKAVDDIFKYRRACKDPDFNALIDYYEKETARILKNKAKIYHAANFVANSLIGMGIGALAIMCPLSLFATVPASVAANMTADYFFDVYYDKDFSGLRYMYEKAMRLCLRKQYTEWLNTGDDPYGLPYIGADKEPVNDPSGFVYEAVESNRLEGVTATIFYKEMIEDMYGEWKENVVVWNAEEYGQENPLFTDAEGNYRWDVPQGLWQVKFEKQGYETALSEWLPVPPPQLDINIGMKQNVQPQVKDAHAYRDAVVIEFDKYMMTGLLTGENIHVTHGDGEAVKPAIIEMLDEENGVATKVRFMVADPFDNEEVTLTVSNRVMSYAGVRMEEDFQQSFYIGEGRGGDIELRHIICDDEQFIGYGDPGMITVTVLPAAGARGRVLHATSTLPMVVGVETEDVVLGENGSAQVAVYGGLPGAATITFTVDSSDLVASTIVNVEEQLFKTCATPTSNIASGVLVDEGTEIRLNCTTPDAIIYYTLDGSCPCEDTPARKVYDGTPIIVKADMTITAMAAANGYEESGVSEFNYFVDTTGIKGIYNVRPMGDGLFYDLHGRKITTPTRKGVYIQKGHKIVIR